MKKEKITLGVQLDETKVPAKLTWSSTDSPNPNHGEEAKAFLLSIFSKDQLDTLKIDLWTKEMQVTEMNTFFYNTLKGLADTYKNATNNTELANQIARFAQFFGEETDVLPKSS